MELSTSQDFVNAVMATSMSETVEHTSTDRKRPLVQDEDKKDTDANAKKQRGEKSEQYANERSSNSYFVTEV